MPSEFIARREEHLVLADVIDGVAIYRKEFGPLRGCPKPKNGVLYIVSAQCLSCQRIDLVAPITLRSKDRKTILGCTGFAY